MKNLDEEMELLAQSKDLNDARQKRCELMIRSFRTKKNPLKCKQLWLGKNILDVHLFHCKDANIIIEGCNGEKNVEVGCLRDVIGTSLLHIAARTNDLAATITLLKLGADINMVNMSGITPLHSAMAQGNTEVAQLLIQKGADTAIESLTWRLFRVPFPGLPKDIWCCNTSKNTGMSIGLKRDLDKQRVLQNTGEPEPKKLKPEPISTDLHYACETNNLDTVIEYSDEGEDLEGRNWRNDTPLISAAKNNALDTVEWLLENNVSLERGGWCYETPLIAASTENNMEIVKLLLDEDADIDATDENGWSSVLVAAKCGYKELCFMLVKEGPNLFLKTKFGDTVLYWIAKHGWTDIFTVIKTGENDFETLLSDASKTSKLYDDKNLPSLLLQKRHLEEPGPAKVRKIDLTTKPVHIFSETATAKNVS